MATNGGGRTPRSQSGARRQQLLQAAARIIESEGVDALRPTRVAQLVGCTRPLVYQYFAHRHDFFIALTEDLYRAVDMDWPPDRQAEILVAIQRGDERPVRAFVERLWDYVDQNGSAPLILRAMPELSSSYGAYLAKVRDSFEQRWLHSFTELGLTEDHAGMVVEAFIGITKTLAVQLATGRINRATATDRHVATVGGLLNGALAAAPTPAAR